MTAPTVETMFRIHKTMKEMLSDRGYDIMPRVMNETIQQFKAKHTPNIEF